MGKLVGTAVLMGSAALVALVVVAVVVVGGSGAAGSSPGSEPDTAGGGGAAAAGAQAGASIPPWWATLYQQAAASCPGLPWSVLASVGTVESANGQSDAAGVWSGSNNAGAEGPMQFEPATFAAYATVGPGGARPPSPYDSVDAVYSAAALLCADGAGSAVGLRGAIDDYNHSTTYVDTVLTLSLAFQQDPSTSGTVVAALSFGARQLGTPYLWGGTGAGGFDCSGLVQAAYRSAGVALPRVAQDQFDAGPAVPDGVAVEPGDLVFFGSGPTGVEHVGLYVGAGEMIDAPHTGATVRFDDASQADLVGATRPA